MKATDLTRRAAAGVAAIALLFSVALPVSAARPGESANGPGHGADSGRIRGVHSRTVTHLTTPWPYAYEIPCPFPVGVERSGIVLTTAFADGFHEWLVVGKATLTNLDTGASIVTRSIYRATDAYNPATNDTTLSIVGQFTLLYPTFVSVVGRAVISIGPAPSNVAEGFALYGTTEVLDARVTSDLCAALDR